MWPSAPKALRASALRARQRQKNPVGASALPTGKFLRVRKVFARIYKIDPKIKSKHCIRLESFRTVWKISRQSGNFLTQSIDQASFNGQFCVYAQKLSGRAKTFRYAMPTRILGFSASALLPLCIIVIFLVQPTYLQLCNLWTTPFRSQIDDVRLRVGGTSIDNQRLN